MIKPEDLTIIIPHLGASPEAEYAADQCWFSLSETVPDVKKMLVLNGPKEKRCVSPKHIFNADIVTTLQGQCLSVNMAAAATNTPWIFITNDDMVYAPGWLEKLVDFSGLEKEPLCVSPMLVEPRSGSPTFQVKFFGGAGGDFNKEGFLEYAQSWKVENNQEKWRTGFNFPVLIKRELWDVIGGYDINYDPWGSNGDSDLEYKIRLAGVQPYQNTDCLVYHFSQTSGTFEPKHNDAWQKNWEYFIKKWGFPRTDAGIWEADFEMPDKDRIFRPEWKGKFLRK
jgi:hypothetical protein